MQMILAMLTLLFVALACPQELLKAEDCSIAPGIKINECTFQFDGGTLVFKTNEAPLVLSDKDLKNEIYVEFPLRGEVANLDSQSTLVEVTFRSKLGERCTILDLGGESFRLSLVQSLQSRLETLSPAKSELDLLEHRRIVSIQRCLCEKGTLLQWGHKLIQAIDDGCFTDVFLPEWLGSLTAEEFDKHVVGDQFSSKHTAFTVGKYRRMSSGQKNLSGSGGAINE